MEISSTTLKIKVTSQTSKKLEIIAEYSKFLLINNDSLIDSIIISKIDPKYCKKRDTSYKTSEEILERLNKITN